MSDTKRPWSTAADNDKLRKRIDDNDKALQRVGLEDVVIEDPRRLFIRSSGGIYFKLTVADDGTLSTVDMGSNPF